MKGSRLTSVSLGLAWLLSLGITFLLGLFLAFAFHLDPDQSREEEGLELRQLGIVIEGILDEPMDYGAMMSMAHRDRLPRQLEEVLDYLVYEPGVLRRERSLEHLAEGLPSRKRMATIQHLLELPAMGERDRALRIFFEQWARNDGRSALALATRLEERYEREAMVHSVLAGWGQARPRDAWQWLLDNPEDAELDRARMGELVWNLAIYHPDQALNLLYDLPESHPAAESAWLAFVDGIAEAFEPREALEWGPRLPVDWLQAELVGVVGDVWGSTRPLRALEWTRESAPDEIVTLLQESVVNSWVRSYPQAAMEWLREQPDGVERRSMIRQAAQGWSRHRGPSPLSQWLSTQAGLHDDWDEAVQVLIIEIMNFNPQAALSWVQVLSDPENRVVFEAMVARNWLLRDPDTALAQLNDLLVSPEVRSLVLNRGAPAPAPVDAQPEDSLMREDGVAEPDSNVID